MRTTLAIARVALVVGAVLALAIPVRAQGVVSAETDTYRYGGTFIRLAAETPAVCAALCAEEHLCEAWSHAPRQFDTPPFCELKSLHGRAENRPGYTSGLAGYHQVGALRDEAGVASSPLGRPVGPNGSRDNLSGIGDGYQPVSSGLDVDELLGANTATAPAPAPPRTSTRAPASASPAPAPYDPYAPKQVRVSSPITGKISSSAASSSSQQSASSSSSSSSTSASTSTSNKPQSGNSQVIEARTTAQARSQDFYRDD